MTTLTIGITIQDTTIIIVKNMDTSLRTALEKNFRGNYSRWLSQTTCFSCHKIGHVRKNFPTRSKAPKFEFDQGKTEVENFRNEMNKTWKKKEIKSTSNGEGITSLNESSGHTSLNYARRKTWELIFTSYIIH